MIAGLQRNHRVHRFADLENEIISPLNFFRCVRKCEAVFANPVDAHVERLAPERFKVEAFRHLRTKSYGQLSIVGQKQVFELRRERTEFFQPRRGDFKFLFFPDEPVGPVLRHPHAEIPA
jgi:hypothetical protein